MVKVVSIDLFVLIKWIEKFQRPLFSLQTTPGELKFALKVESKLNSLPDPEYRQLVVEVLMVLGLAAKSSSLTSFGDFPIAVEHIINQARDLFLRDQVRTASACA